MSAITDLALMRASALLEANPTEAAAQAGGILAQDPGNEPAALLLAAACRGIGDGSRAVKLLESLVARHPDSALLQLELGRHFAFAGRDGDAIEALRRAVGLDERLSPAWLELSQLLLKAGDIPAADAAYLSFRRLVRNPPDLGEAYAAFANGRLDDALLFTQRRLQAGTNEVAAFSLLAAIAAKRDDEFGQEGSLHEVLRLAPSDNSARAQLADLFVRQDRTSEAAPLIERLLKADPNDRESLLIQVDALRQAENFDPAMNTIAAMLERGPADAELWLVRAHLQRYMGNREDAIASLHKAIELRPGYGAAYLALSNFQTYHFAAAEIHAMQAQHAANIAAATEDMDLEFALGKALEDEGRYQDSFAHYERANRIARSGFEYSPQLMTTYVERCKRTFTREFFAERQGWGSLAVDPIFVVGLPRTGSTLIEQILASHSAVEGTRELMNLPLIARSLATVPGASIPYPENLAALAREDFMRLADRYLDGTRARRLLERPRFIDKMYANFHNLGLIHLMFPDATIIDTRRHPLASAFACFKQKFRPGMGFAYDLAELGMYYRDYVELLDHIDAALPGRVYRVHYERLVTDTELEVRRLLAHCRLSYEPNCLRFHENSRVAQTFSSEQVRRPVYREGVDQWRNYEPWLEPLKDSLGPLADAYARQIS